MSDERLLEAVGLGDAESTVYLRLLAEASGSPAELSKALDRPVDEIAASLDGLIEAGLVTRLPGEPVRYVPAEPDVALDALVLHRQGELERLRARTRQLAQQFHSATERRSGSLVELVEGPQALRQRIAQMQLSAQAEVLLVDCPPYIASTERPEENPVQYQIMARGVAYRTIYHAPSLDSRMDEVRECITAGEQARSLPSVREKMMIVDRHCALMPLSFDDAGMQASVYVRDSPLLVALVSCFEMLWDRATPIGVNEHSALDKADRELLLMLTSGMKDAAIMRSLGITQRTMTRRIGRLLNTLDASTRFQAGAQAARRGLL